MWVAAPRLHRPVLPPPPPPPPAPGVSIPAPLLHPVLQCGDSTLVSDAEDALSMPLLARRTGSGSGAAAGRPINGSGQRLEPAGPHSTEEDERPVSRISSLPSRSRLGSLADLSG